MVEKKAVKNPAKATIYVDVEDEITSIIDKMESAGQKDVALVLPKRASVMQSIVNMRLLKRSADNADKNVVLITAEAALLPLAGAAGLHVADSPNSKPYIPAAPTGLGAPASKKTTPKPDLPAEETEGVKDETEDDMPSKIDYKKPIGDLATVHETEHPDTIEIGDEEDSVKAAAADTQKQPKAPKHSKIKVPNFDKFRLSIGIAVAGLIALIIFLYLALAVLPKATIAIQTVSTPVSANFSLTTSGTAKALTSDTIPAMLKSSDQTGSQTVAASGQQNNGDKSKGKVTLSLNDCSRPTVTIPAGAPIVGGGFTFVNQDNTTLSSVIVGGQCKNSSFPSSSTATVNVIAQSGGSKQDDVLSSPTTMTASGCYNGCSGVSAQSASLTTKGSDNTVTVVSQADVDSAVAKAKSAQSSNFTTNFENQLGQQNLYVLVSTLKAADPVTTATPAVGQAGSTTTVSVKITYSILVINKADLISAVSAVLSKQVDPKKQKIDSADIIKGVSINVADQSSPTTATLDITENTSAVPIIDPAAIKKQVAGKKSGDITSEISALPGVKNVNVSFHPFWVSKAPKASKITVTLQHVNNSSSGQ